MTIKFQDLSRLHETIRVDLTEAFEQVLSRSSFIQGEPVKSFEKEFAHFTGAPHCLGVGNGTDALEIALEALEIGAGDTVAVPSMTFVATAEAVVRCGATPILVDVDPQTLCMTAATLEQAIRGSSNKPRALIAVHLYGRTCNMSELLAFAKQHEMRVIEDCAQAHGARLNGKHVGTFGDVGTFSFYPGKNLGALGDAGAVVTNSNDLFERMRLLRDHGRTEKYLHQRVGRNSRLDGLQAEFLRVKLKRLEAWTHSRQQLAAVYAKQLSGLDCVEMLPLPSHRESHAFHLLVIRVRGDQKSRDALANHLKENQIETGIHYPLGVHMQPAFKSFTSSIGLRTTERATSEILSLPMDPLMTEDEVKRVCNTIRKFYD